MTYTMFFFTLPIMVSRLRLLRCMPISGAVLTHLLLFTPILILSVIGLIGPGIDAAIHSGTPQPRFSQCCFSL